MPGFTEAHCMRSAAAARLKSVMPLLCGVSAGAGVGASAPPLHEELAVVVQQQAVQHPAARDHALECV